MLKHIGIMEENKKTKEIDLLALVEKVLHEWRLLLKFIAVAAVIGVIVALNTPKYFKAEVRFLTKVSPESFIPSPKVDSSVVELKPKDIKSIKTDDGEFEIDDEAYKVYSKVVKALFQHRNKKSKNALIDSRHIIGFKDKKELKGILNKLEDENPKVKELLLERTINLSPESIMELSILLKDHLN